MHSTVARHQDFGDANKMLKMQGVANKILKMQRVANKILKMQGNANKMLKMHGVANKILKRQEECRQDFDIVWTCPWRRDDATPTSDVGGR